MLMKKQPMLWATALFVPVMLLAQQNTDIPLDYLDRSFQTYDQIQKAIWSASELGFLETQSSGILQEHLRSQGFSVKTAQAGMPTAFVATYGSGSPVIGILAE